MRTEDIKTQQNQYIQTLEDEVLRSVNLADLTTFFIPFAVERQVVESFMNVDFQRKR
jgi:hypothetical protein